MKTIEELEKIRIEKRKELDLRVNTESDTREKHILVCRGTGCTSSKSPKIIENFRRIIEERNIQNVRVIQTGCFGLCAKGPIVIIRPEETFYAHVKPEDCEEIIEKHICNGQKVERLLCKDIDGTIVNKLDDLTFYKKQKRIALKNCGVIDPENIDEYIAFDGYKAIEKVLTTMSTDDVIDVISKSGLRGRGGAGFPTGKKWSFAKAEVNEQKYVVCNADEGDPGAFMDRSILEGDPHCVLEAMAIAGYAIGANQGYIYVSIENRGANAPRGREWRKCIYGEVGTFACEDQARGIQDLARQYSFIDLSRIGITGWSGGGSQTLNCMFRYPSVFHTGIAIAFVSDQRLYDTIYQERYMNTPQNNPEGYRKGSPITYANGLEGNLLLIHGTGDDNVHYQSCEMLVDKLVEYGKMFSQISYPMRSHGIYERKGTTLHLRKSMAKYWLEHLPAGGK